MVSVSLLRMVCLKCLVDLQICSNFLGEFDLQICGKTKSRNHDQDILKINGMSKMSSWSSNLVKIFLKILSNFLAKFDF